MPKYMVAASYTAEGLKGLQKDKASGRRAAVQKVVEGLGGKVEAMYFALGDHDVIVIVDLPNTVAATALALGVSASGLVRTKTTALLSVEETDQALGKKTRLQPPGPIGAKSVTVGRRLGKAAERGFAHANALLAAIANGSGADTARRAFAPALRAPCGLELPHCGISVMVRITLEVGRELTVGSLFSFCTISSYSASVCSGAFGTMCTIL